MLFPPLFIYISLFYIFSKSPAKSSKIFLKDVAGCFGFIIYQFTFILFLNHVICRFAYLLELRLSNSIDLSSGCLFSKYEINSLYPIAFMDWQFLNPCLYRAYTRSEER